MGPQPDKSRLGNYSITDLMQGSLSINVVHRTPFLVDELANEVFYVISANREAFRAQGIHKVTSLNLGKENIVSLTASSVKVTLIPINISFLVLETVFKNTSLFTQKLYYDDVKLTEGLEYIINGDGKTIKLFDPIPDGKQLLANFKDSVTLEQKTSVPLTIDLIDNTLYTVPDPFGVYGIYKL